MSLRTLRFRAARVERRIIPPETTEITVTIRDVHDETRVPDLADAAGRRWRREDGETVDDFRFRVIAASQADVGPVRLAIFWPEPMENIQ